MSEYAHRAEQWADWGWPPAFSRTPCFGVGNVYRVRANRVRKAWREAIGLMKDGISAQWDAREYHEHKTNAWRLESFKAKWRIWGKED